MGINISAIKKNSNSVFELARRNIKTQYRGSFLGVIWTILNPLLTMLVMWFVFSSIFGRSVYYPIYLLCGNVLFSALRASSNASLVSIQNNRNLLLRTKINSWVFPCSATVASLINFALSLIALIPFMIWLSISQDFNLFTYRLFFILLMLPAFWMFEYGLNLFLSVLYIFFKDIKNIHTVFILLWQYLTPIFYTVDRFYDASGNVKEGAEAILWVIKLNPMFHFTNYLRECVYMGATGTDPMFPNDIGAVMSYSPLWKTLGILYLSGIILLVIGVVAHHIFKNKLILKL